MDRSKKSIHSARAEFPARFRVDVQHVGLRHLDRPQGVDLERPPAFLLRDDAVVGERDLGVEAVRQHPLVVAHQLVVDADIPQVQARQFGDVAVVLRVQPGAENVDDLDRAGFLGAGLEQFFLAGADGPVLELLFDDLQAFGDLLLVDARAVASKQELDHIGRNRILARVFPHEVLSDEVSVENRCGQLVELIEFYTHASSPTVVGL